MEKLLLCFRMNKVEEKQTFAPKEEIEEKVSGKLIASIYKIANPFQYNKY